MKVLILGATGLAGQAMVRTAAARGHTVAAAARQGAPLSIDITEGTALLASIAAEEPEGGVNHD